MPLSQSPGTTAALSNPQRDASSADTTEGDRSLTWFYGTVASQDGIAGSAIHQFESSLNPYTVPRSLPTMSRNSRGSTRGSAIADSSFSIAERGQVVIPQPEVMQNYLYPINEVTKKKIIKYRDVISALLTKQEAAAWGSGSGAGSGAGSQPPAAKDPLLVITGPSHIVDPTQAKACAQWISVISGKRKFELKRTSKHNKNSEKADQYLDRVYVGNSAISTKDLVISMRANLNKYNYDHELYYPEPIKPSLMTFEIENGIPICRALLCELCQYCPLVGQLSDTVTPQYMSDLFCLGIVDGAMTESQLHRELVSGVSYPVGFHTANGSTTKIESAVNAIKSSSHPHHFLTINKFGNVCIAGTIGNRDTFVIVPLDDKLNLDFSSSSSSSSPSPSSPRIMIDIGKVNRENYHVKYLQIEKLLQDDALCVSLMGFMIDSGEDYLHDQFKLTEKVLTSSSNNNNEKDPFVTFEFNNLRKKMEKINQDVERDFEQLYLTDKLIHKLVKVSRRRKELLLKKK